MHLLQFFSLLLVTPNPIIKNGDLPVCKQCRFFIRGIDNADHLAKCAMYGTKDVITGDILYEFADHVRYNANQCGINGLNFEEKKTNGLFEYIHT